MGCNLKAKRLQLWRPLASRNNVAFVSGSSKLEQEVITFTSLGARLRAMPADVKEVKQGHVVPNWLERIHGASEGQEAPPVSGPRSLREATAGVGRGQRHLVMLEAGKPTATPGSPRKGAEVAATGRRRRRTHH